MTGISPSRITRTFCERYTSGSATTTSEFTAWPVRSNDHLPIYGGCTAHLTIWEGDGNAHAIYFFFDIRILVLVAVHINQDANMAEGWDRGWRAGWRWDE